MAITNNNKNQKKEENKLHGFPGSESDAFGIGDKLAQSGINSLTFNYSGTYKSEGKVSWDNMQLDIDAAYHPEVKVVFSIAPSDQTEFMKVYTCNTEIKKMIDKVHADLTFTKGHLRFDAGALWRYLFYLCTDHYKLRVQKIYN